MQNPKPSRRILAFTHDSVMAALAFGLALYLRVGNNFGVLSFMAVLQAFATFVITCSIMFGVCGLYRSIWAFTSLRDLMQILRAATIAVLAFLVVSFLTNRLEGVPRAVPFIAWFILIAALSGPRLAVRMLRERRLSNLWQRSGGGRVNVLLVGAGDEADLFLRALSANPQAALNVVGIVGENERRVGRSIHGIDVMGSVDELDAIVARLRAENRAPSRIILTRSLTRMNGELAASLLEQSTNLGLNLSRLPALTDLRDDVGGSAVQDQPVVLEDLLGRPETKLNRADIRALVKGKRVLVTGAGGTIGAELVRQISALEPSHLILCEFCEFNLYRIDIEIREAYPYQGLSSLIADVRDAARIEQIFQTEKPDLVFHAAAIKHVPIAEANARETILTNVHGTRLVADCAARANCTAMVMISTDKAVNPANVMGATKRLAEMYCQALDLASTSTRFMTVRFGNVLGSTGSVVPRFQEQLAKGGPITVTHPDITRYFMTVREAVELVLQASTLGMRPDETKGRVLVLDMGQPVKIADLARQMIRLAGLRPDDDIKIVFTGLRPGEKLHEQLFGASEELLPSAADGVQIAKATTSALATLKLALDNMTDELQRGADEPTAVAKLESLVPEFKRGAALLKAAE